VPTLQLELPPGDATAPVAPPSSANQVRPVLFSRRPGGGKSGVPSSARLLSGLLPVSSHDYQPKCGSPHLSGFQSGSHQGLLPRYVPLTDFALGGRREMATETLETGWGGEIKVFDGLDEIRAEGDH